MHKQFDQQLEVAPIGKTAINLNSRHQLPLGLLGLQKRFVLSILFILITVFACQNNKSNKQPDTLMAWKEMTQEAKNDMLKAKNKAKEVNAQTLARETYDKALEKEQIAEKNFQRNSSTYLKTATENFSYAKEDFKRATEQALSKQEALKQTEADKAFALRETTEAKALKQTEVEEAFATQEALKQIEAEEALAKQEDLTRAEAALEKKEDLKRAKAKNALAKQEDIKKVYAELARKEAEIRTQAESSRKVVRRVRESISGIAKEKEDYIEAEVWLGKGDNHYSANEFEDAIRDYEKAKDFIRNGQKCASRNAPIRTGK